MILVFVPQNGVVTRIEIPPGADIPANAVWVDLLSPSNEEAAAVNRAFGLELPTREEQVEIEPSSRLYQEGDAIYMTATVFTQADTPNPTSDVITFIVTKRVFVTLRSVEPRPIVNFMARVQRIPGLCGVPEDALIGLVETFVDRIADILERLGVDLDGLSRLIFDDRPSTARRRSGQRRDLQAILRSLGRADDLVSTARESLHSLARMQRYAGPAADATLRKDHKLRLKTLSRDILSLGEQAAFESHKVNFLLDATLGMINIEQNRIIKLFSVVAVVFLPPTLIASIYGMNFQYMPELEWPLGYPLAVVLVLISAVAPYFYFKRKGWM